MIVENKAEEGELVDSRNSNDRFTDDELAIAKSVDLCAVAESLGYTVKRIGKYHTIKEMDSIRIYNRSHWYRWSRQFDKGNNGGSQIDFLRVFCGMSVKAVSYPHLTLPTNREESTADGAEGIEKIMIE